jgi:hypothetical protein
VANEPRRLIATLEERQKFRRIALVLLLLFQFVMVWAFSTTKSAVQEASIGTIWITGNILLGIGVIVGRRRTYHVLREPENTDEAVTSGAISEWKRKDRNNLTIALVIVAALALAWQYFSGGQAWRTFFQ